MLKEFVRGKDVRSALENCKHALMDRIGDAVITSKHVDKWLPGIWLASYKLDPVQDDSPTPVQE